MIPKSFVNNTKYKYVRKPLEKKRFYLVSEITCKFRKYVTSKNHANDTKKIRKSYVVENVIMTLL